jgi:hypothetical protein
MLRRAQVKLPETIFFMYARLLKFHLLIRISQKTLRRLFTPKAATRWNCSIASRKPILAAACRSKTVFPS